MHCTQMLFESKIHIKDKLFIRRTFNSNYFECEEKSSFCVILFFWYASVMKMQTQECKVERSGGNQQFTCNKTALRVVTTVLLPYEPRFVLLFQFQVCITCHYIILVATAVADGLTCVTGHHRGLAAQCNKQGKKGKSYFLLDSDTGTIREYGGFR